MALELPSIALLHDFLYADRDRLASFGAQLHDSGVLASTKSVELTSSQSSGSIGVPGTSVGGFSATSSSLEQVFDTSHTLPLFVLDALDEAGLIQRDLPAAGLGSIFLIEGRMRFLDYRLLKNCWESIHNITLSEQQARGQHLKQGERASLKNNFKIIEALPYQTEITFYSSFGNIWTTINPVYLRVEAASLAFAHGTVIPGDWLMVAVLDARPDEPGQVTVDNAAMPLATEFQVGMAQAMEAIRTFLGRPASAYAATPLLIFRTTEQPASPEQAMDTKTSS